MGRFLAPYELGSVAANDIGTIDFMADLHPAELVRPVDAEVLKRKRRHAYTTEIIPSEELENHTQIAIVYDDWFSIHPKSVFGDPPRPSSWIRVQRWQVPKAGQLGADTVSFCAVIPAQRRYLKGSLPAFKACLLRTGEVFR